MNLENKQKINFQSNLLRYGTAIEQWPADVRSNGHVLLNSPQGQALYREYCAIDSLIKVAKQQLSSDSAVDASQFLKRLNQIPQRAIANTNSAKITTFLEPLQLSMRRFRMLLLTMLFSLFSGIIFASFQSNSTEIGLDETLFQEIIVVTEEP